MKKLLWLDDLREPKGYYSEKDTWISKTKVGWVAAISVELKKYNLGTYKTKEEAAAAFNKAALKYRGKEAKLNIIPTSDSPA